MTGISLDGDEEGAEKEVGLTVEHTSRCEKVGSLEYSRSKTANRGGKVIISHWSSQGQWDLRPLLQERNYGADWDRTRNVFTKL